MAEGFSGPPSRAAHGSEAWTGPTTHAPGECGRRTGLSQSRRALRGGAQSLTGTRTHLDTVAPALHTTPEETDGAGLRAGGQSSQGAESFCVLDNQGGSILRVTLSVPPSDTRAASKPRAGHSDKGTHAKNMGGDPQAFWELKPQHQAQRRCGGDGGRGTRGTTASTSRRRRRGRRGRRRSVTPQMMRTCPPWPLGSLPCSGIHGVKVNTLLFPNGRREEGAEGWLAEVLEWALGDRS